MASQSSEILVLCTDWRCDFWDKDGEAPYPKRNVGPVIRLRSQLPIAGIGIYTQGRKQDCRAVPPSYLSVKGIRTNEKGEPVFDFEVIGKIEGMTSSRLLEAVGDKGLFFTLKAEETAAVLSRLGAKPPPRWESLVGRSVPSSWEEWIGSRFSRILGEISNDGYEDRAKELFVALGFEVDQMGHLRPGEFPDGVLYGKDFALVYDCKNRRDYFLNAEDKRAMITYVQKWRKRIQEEKDIEDISFAFLAHSFDVSTRNLDETVKEARAPGTMITSEALLYVLYQKLTLGRRFVQDDFRTLITRRSVTKEEVETVYSRT